MDPSTKMAGVEAMCSRSSKLYQPIPRDAAINTASLSLFTTTTTNSSNIETSEDTNENSEKNHFSEMFEK